MIFFIFISLEILKGDWLVNDDTIGGTIQSQLSLGMNHKGKCVVVWKDYRSTDYDTDIYCQIYLNQLIPLNGNFIVNEEKGGPHWQLWWHEGEPSVSVGDSIFVVVWNDYYGNGWHCDVYLRIYSLKGTLLSGEIKVSERGNIKGTPIPSIGEDFFVVVWSDGREGEYNIYAQLYNSDGTPMGSNFIVNENKTNQQISPDVAVGKNNFVIVWEDWRNGVAEVYGQIYDREGNPIRNNFRIAKGKRPKISMDDIGNFIVIWEEVPYIYGKLYLNDGTPFGEEFRVTVGSNGVVSMNSYGYFGVSWVRGGVLYCKVYDCSLRVVGGEFKITNNIHSSSVVALSDSDIVVSWIDSRANNPDVYIQRFTFSGIERSNVLKVNDDGASSIQDYPVIGMDGDGNFMIVWYDYRNGVKNPDIYGQRYTKEGEPIGINFKINDDVGENLQYSPSIAVNFQGRFVVVWQDTRDFTGGRFHIYGQLYDEEGKPVGGNFRVSEVSGSNGWPCVSINDLGNFIVVWHNVGNERKASVWGQIYNRSGERVGKNFKLNETPIIGNWLPSVTLLNNDEFIVCWVETNYGIWGQKWNSLGIPIGTPFRIDDVEGVNNCHHSSIDSDKEGNFTIVWMDQREPKIDIFMQRYGKLCNPVGKNFKINPEENDGDQYNPQVAINKETGEFIAVWSGWRRKNLEVCAQIYNKDGSPQGNTFVVNNDIFYPDHHQWAWKSVATNGELVAFTWIDNRRLKEWDIYAKLMRWEKSTPTPFSSLFIYPNPCSQFLNIKSTIPLLSKFRVDFYDITGRKQVKIRKIVHTDEWIKLDVGECNSGVYFIKTNDSPYFCKKVIILKK